MAMTAQERPLTPLARRTGSRVTQCSTRVHTFYGTQDSAEAVARAKSTHGLFFVARKCSACSGWRLFRLA
jgi:hypothetical protein